MKTKNYIDNKIPFIYENGLTYYFQLKLKNENDVIHIYIKKKFIINYYKLVAKKTIIENNSPHHFSLISHINGALRLHSDISNPTKFIYIGDETVRMQVLRDHKLNNI